MPVIYINAAVRSSRYDEAAARVPEEMPAALRQAGGVEAFQLGYLAMGDSKKVPAAREALQRLVQDSWSRMDNLWRQLLMVQLTRLGAVDQAYHVANRSLDDYMRDNWNGGAWGLLWTPEMRAFRKDSRFQVFVTRLKLIDYWKQFGPPDECAMHGETLVCR
jgi:hypothetical protein